MASARLEIDIKHLDEVRLILNEYADFIEAIRELNAAHNLGDLVYTVKASELKGWDGPRVTAWGEAVRRMNMILRKYPAASAPPTTGDANAS